MEKQVPATTATRMANAAALLRNFSLACVRAAEAGQADQNASC